MKRRRNFFTATGVYKKLVIQYQKKIKASSPISIQFYACKDRSRTMPYWFFIPPSWPIVKKGSQWRDSINFRLENCMEKLCSKVRSLWQFHWKRSSKGENNLQFRHLFMQGKWPSSLKAKRFYLALFCEISFS